MHSPAALLAELGAVLLALSLLAVLGRRTGISPVPFFLLAGLAVGNGGIVPFEAAADFLAIGGDIGVVLLLLTLGLEFSAAEFAVSMRHHYPSGVVDLLLNAPAGVAAGVYLGLGWEASLALGGVTWISSSGIVARVLEDLGRLGNRETPAVLSVLVLEDIAMAAYLPLLAVLLGGGSLLQALAGATLAVAVVLGVLVASTRWGPRAGALLTTDDDEQLLFRVLGLTLLVAGLAEQLDASAAVGAFVVGLALDGEVAESARRVLRPLRDLFAAAFFLRFGFDTDPAAVLPVLQLALALAAVSAATKLATGWLAAGRDGVGRPGRLRAGTALVARGEFSVVVAGLAVAAGFPEVGPVVTAYVLILAVVGPVLTRIAGAAR